MKHRRSAIATVCGLAIALWCIAGTPLATQGTRFDVPDEDRQAARALLASGSATFLSGSGLTAASFLAGDSPDPDDLAPGPGVEVAGPTAGYGHGRSEQEEADDVIVNNPAQDVFTAADITTQSETSLAAFGSTVVVTFNDSGSTQTAPFNSIMGYSRSTDGGRTFTDLGAMPAPSPTGFNLGDPGLVVNRAGQFYSSAIAFNAALPLGFRNTLSVQKSTDGGATFGPPVYLPAAGTSAGSFQDKEFIAVDNAGGSPFAGNVYLSWTSFPSGPSTSLPIFFSRSTNGGASFSTPIQISANNTINQGSEPAVGPGGVLYVAWFQFAGPGGPGIVVAKSTNGGATFGAPVFVAPSNRIGNGAGSLLGNFRVNSFPRIDVNPVNGHVYIVYTSRTPGVDPGDVFFTRSTNGGATWSAPGRVNTDALGEAAQFFPDLAVDGQGRIRLVWYQSKIDEDNPPNVRIDVIGTGSNDGGLSFTRAERINSEHEAPAVGFDPIINRIYMGDYLDVKAGVTAAGVGNATFAAWGDFRRIITTNGGIRRDQDVFFAPLSR
jgi:hypothetical protein